MGQLPDGEECKPHNHDTMKAIAKARRAYQKTGSFSVSSAMTGVNRQTLKTWARRYGWQRSNEPKVKPEPKPEAKALGAWMQSVYHDSAHFITAGHAACEDAANGVHCLPGVVWLQHDGNLRKCLRCMKRQNAADETRRQ